MLLWERLPKLRVLKFVQPNFSNGLHQLIPFAYSLPNVEELALVSCYAAQATQAHGGWALWLFLEDLTKLLLEPGMHAPLEALDLSCMVTSMNTILLPRHLTDTLHSQAWAPVIAPLSQTLRHCTLGLLAEECSPANLAQFYSALLQLLSVVCNSCPNDTAEYRPFLFLDALADSPSPFPALETLELDLLQHQALMLVGCAEACVNLASDMEDRTRFPYSKHLGVRRKTTKDARTADRSVPAHEQMAAQEIIFRSCFGRLEAVGMQVEVSVA